MFIVILNEPLKLGDCLVNYGKVSQLTKNFVYTTSGACFKKNLVDFNLILLQVK